MVRMCKSGSRSFNQTLSHSVREQPVSRHTEVDASALGYSMISVVPVTEAKPSSDIRFQVDRRLHKW